MRLKLEQQNKEHVCYKEMVSGTKMKQLYHLMDIGCKYLSPRDKQYFQQILITELYLCDHL